MGLGPKIARIAITERENEEQRREEKSGQVKGYGGEGMRKGKCQGFERGTSQVSPENVDGCLPITVVASPQLLYFGTLVSYSSLGITSIPILDLLYLATKVSGQRNSRIREI
jgi:hypothetical protein